MARRRSKRGEFCSLTTLLEDDSSRTSTWPLLVISDLFPVEQVQTPGGQELDGLPLATRPLFCWDVLIALFSICFNIFSFLWTNILGKKRSGSFLSVNCSLSSSSSRVQIPGG